MTPQQEYYAAKELIYSAHKECVKTYDAWKEACQKLYTLERKCNELYKKVNKNEHD